MEGIQAWMIWLAGGATTILTGVITFLFGRTASLQRQIDQGALTFEQRFALKSDLTELRDHVDSRFDRMEQNQEASRKQIVDEIRSRH